MKKNVFVLLTLLMSTIVASADSSLLADLTASCNAKYEAYKAIKNECQRDLKNKVKTFNQYRVPPPNGDSCKTVNTAYGAVMDSAGKCSETIGECTKVCNTVSDKIKIRDFDEAKLLKENGALANRWNAASRTAHSHSNECRQAGDKVWNSGFRDIKTPSCDEIANTESTETVDPTQTSPSSPSIPSGVTDKPDHSGDSETVQ